MRLSEKLYKEMFRRSMNQQKLAKLSGVSDSEVSRILAGKSNPGLENAFRLARAVGCSLDYLADDSLDADPSQGEGLMAEEEREILEGARDLGLSRAARVLELVRILGYESAMRRLVLEAKPSLEGAESPARAGRASHG